MSTTDEDWVKQIDKLNKALEASRKRYGQEVQDRRRTEIEHEEQVFRLQNQVEGKAELYAALQSAVTELRREIFIPDNQARGTIIAQQEADRRVERYWEVLAKYAPKTEETEKC